MTDKELALRNVISTMTLEGIDMTVDDIEGVREIIYGERDAEDAISEIRERYLAIAKAGNQKVSAN